MSLFVGISIKSGDIIRRMKLSSPLLVNISAALSAAARQNITVQETGSRDTVASPADTVLFAKKIFR